MESGDADAAPGVQKSTPAKRLRWATTRVKGQKASQKRMSIFNRRLSRRSADEKKRESAGSDPSDPKLEQNAAQDDAEGGDSPQSRTIYFNIPLPDSERDEQGRPLHHYARNKIRTAKYTPLSFIPKNLYYQFHNIANIYFFIVIILGVRIGFRSNWKAASALTCDRYSRSLVSSSPAWPQCL
jgi:phospholipid-translocating ATPase